MQHASAYHMRLEQAVGVFRANFLSAEAQEAAHLKELKDAREKVLEMVDIRTRTLIHSHTHMHTQACARTHTRTHTHTDTHTHARTHTSTLTHAYTHTHTCTLTRTCTHTHTNNHPRKQVED